MCTNEIKVSLPCSSKKKVGVKECHEVFCRKNSNGYGGEAFCQPCGISCSQFSDLYAYTILQSEWELLLRDINWRFIPKRILNKYSRHDTLHSICVVFYFFRRNTSGMNGLYFREVSGFWFAAAIEENTSWKRPQTVLSDSDLGFNGQVCNTK